ncbi:hypothetical protein D9M68_669610 [compost metagenome]
MCRHQDSRIHILRNTDQQLHDLIRSIRVQVTCRLISQDQLRVIQQGTGYIHPLLFTATHFIGLFIAFCRQVHQVQYFFNTGLHLLGISPSRSLQHKLQVLVYITIRKQFKILEYYTHFTAQERNFFPVHITQIRTHNNTITLYQRQFTI